MVPPMEMSSLLRQCFKFFEVFSGLLFSVSVSAGYHDFTRGGYGTHRFPPFYSCPSGCSHDYCLMNNPYYPQPNGIQPEGRAWNVHYTNSTAKVLTENCPYENNHTASARVRIETRVPSFPDAFPPAYSALNVVAPGVQSFEIELNRPSGPSAGSQYWSCDVSGTGEVMCKKDVLRPVKNEHYKLVVYEGKTYSRCLLCNPEKEKLDCKKLRYKGLSGIKLHYKTHFGIREYSCSIAGCGKSFTSSQNLKTHILKHQGKKQFRCSHDNCNGTFTTQGALSGHLSLHKGEKPFICDYPGCSKGYVNAKRLKRHANSHPGGKRFNCKFCKKIHNDIHQMRQHQLSCRDNPRRLPVKDIRAIRKRMREARVAARVTGSVN